MTEDTKGSLRWLADIMGRAWEPRSGSNGAAKDASPIADSLLPTDLALDPTYLLGIVVPSRVSDELVERSAA